MFAPVAHLTAWERETQGLVCGITSVLPGQLAGSQSDFGLATGGVESDLVARYERLAVGLGLGAVAVARQVHGCRVVSVPSSPARGLHVQGEADGLVSGASGVLLVVTVADCVPVFLADRAGRHIAVLHAGWRGIAAGVLRAGVAQMRERFGVLPGNLRAHLGPAICGACYEVGPEVLLAMGRPSATGGKLNLRQELADRALEAGIPADHMTRSRVCTVCGPGFHYSYRASGESAGRMAAFIGRIAGT